MKTQKVFLVNEVIIILNNKLSSKIAGEKKKKHTTNKTEVTESVYNGVAEDSNGLIQQRVHKLIISNQQFPTMENEDSNR